MMLILHGGAPSPFARKTIAVLEEEGIAYEHRNLAPIPKTPQLLAMNPIGKIPILEDGGTFIPDSSVICAYLERIHPEPAVYPKDPKEFAAALFLEEYSDTAVAAAIGPMFFERFIKKVLLKAPADEAIVAKALAEAVPPVLAYLESRAPRRPGPVLGAFSIADAALGGHLGSLRLAGISIDAARYPKLAAYSDALLERPSFAKALASCQP
jgi:glutathione S-transferase